MWNLYVCGFEKMSIYIYMSKPHQGEMADVPRRKMGARMKAKSHRRCGKFLAMLGTQARLKSEIHTWREMNLHGFAIFYPSKMIVAFILGAPFELALPSHF